MFEHIGTNNDPNQRTRTVQAWALTGMLAVVVRVGASVVMWAIPVLSGVFSEQALPEQLIDVRPVDLAMLEVVFNDPVLSADDLPAPPEIPEVPPIPEVAEIPEVPETPEEPNRPEGSDAADVPATESPDAADPPEQPVDGEAPSAPDEPAAVPVEEGVEADEMDEVVLELKQLPDEVTDGVAEGEVEPEETEEARLARELRAGTMEELRLEGLLSMGDLGFDRMSLDPGYDDEERTWDGLFGPLDSHILFAALREGRIDTLREEREAESTGGFTMQMASFGMGWFGGGGPQRAIRLPAPRAVDVAAKPRYLRRFRREFGDVDCLLHVTVDGEGHPIGFVVKDCPEPLHEFALSAAHKSSWMPSANGLNATVSFQVEFRK